MKKKVLLVAPVLDIGGAEKVVRDIAYYANPDEYEMHLLILKDKVGVYEAELLARGCKSVHIPEPSENYAAYFLTLLKLMRKEKYYAVHVHTMFNSGWVMLASRLTGIPVRVAHAHSALMDNNNCIKKIYECTMQGLIRSCATDFIGCGVAAGQRLFGRKTFEQRGELILNGIDVHSFAYSSEKRNEIRRQLNIQDKFVLGHTGHLVKVKNQVFLLELMPLVLEKCPNALLLMLGEGPDRCMLEGKIQDMGLQDHVIMTGNVSNVSDYLSAMDVFVFPSLYEGLPLSVLEVQANGLPCVISNSVPDDVFLTDLICPLSLDIPKDRWIEAIVNAKRNDTSSYNKMLQKSEYTVERAMEKIYHIYEKGEK